MGGDLLSSEKTSYKFEYSFNPSYNEIHKREIVRSWAFPSIRQSLSNDNAFNYKSTAPLSSYNETRVGTDGLPIVPDLLHTSILPNEFLIDFPFEEKYYKFDGTNTDLNELAVHGNLSQIQTLQFGKVAEIITKPLKPVIDELGYFYGTSCTKCPQAWSLTKIIYPTGGEVSFEYESVPYSRENDAPNWSFDEKNVPIIKDYNKLAEYRSVIQNEYNVFANVIYENSAPFLRKMLTATYEMSLPSYLGIRLKSKKVNDKINPIVEVTYEYGALHSTSLPGAFLQNYISGFNSFVTREHQRHGWERYKNIIQMFDGANPVYYIDYEDEMSWITRTNISVDNYSSTLFYEYIDQKYSDHSKVRSYYGSIDYDSTILSGIFDQYNVFCSKAIGNVKNDRYVIGGSPSLASPVVNYRTSYFEANNSVPYKIESSSFEYVDLGMRSIQFNYGTSKVIFDHEFPNWLPIYGTNIRPFGILILWILI